MKKLFIIISLLILPVNIMATDQSFDISIKLLKPIYINKVQDLLFPPTTLTGSDFDLTVLPSDSGAAVFNAQGGNNRNITKSVVESSINASAVGITGTISVNNFVLTGPTAFDGTGSASGIRVGATVHILAISEDGNYTGTATLRVVYL